MLHMKNLRRILRAAASIAGTGISTNVLADPSQGGSGSGSGYGMNSGMMDGYGVGWMNGGWMNGYGGIWAPILLVIVVVALVAWIVQQKKK